MGTERFWTATQPPGEVENGSRMFGPTAGVAIDAMIPNTPTRRFLRYAGEVWTEGPMMSQLEVWLGGASGATWGRVNVELPAAGWQAVAGCFDHVNATDPERVILRCRSYESGAGAKLRGFRVDGIDVSGLTSGSAWVPDTGVGEVTPTTEIIPAGQSTIARSIGLSGIPSGRYRVCASVELAPNSSQSATVQLLGDGHTLGEWPVPGYGLNDRMIGLAPMLVYEVVGGTRTWDLRITAAPDAAARIRRAGLFVVNWDEVLA